MQEETPENPLTLANGPWCSVCQHTCGQQQQLVRLMLRCQKSLLPSNTRPRGSLPFLGEPGWDGPPELGLQRAWKSSYLHIFYYHRGFKTSKNWPLMLHSSRIYFSFSSSLTWLFPASESHPKEFRGRLLPGFESGVAGGGRQTPAHLHPRRVSEQHWPWLLMGLDPGERGLMRNIATKHISLLS